MLRTVRLGRSFILLSIGTLVACGASGDANQAATSEDDPDLATPTFDPIVDRAGEDRTAPQGELSLPDKALAVAPELTLAANTVQSGYTGDLVTWKDSSGQNRTAFMVRPGADPAGAQGAYLRTMTYVQGGTTRTIGPSTMEPGFGFVYAQRTSDYAVFSSKYVAGTRTVRSQGPHHLVLEYQWANLKTSGGVSSPAKATVQWTFVAGRDHPLWQITYDTSAAAANAVDMDTKSPYGGLEFTGVAGTAIDGLGWGDRRKMKTTSTPLSMNSTWDYTATNVVPYVQTWSTTRNAEMGLVQTERYTRHDAGYGWFYSNWGKTSATKIVDGGSPASQSMPANWNWTYLLNQYQLPDATRKLMGWGMNFGAVGKSSVSGYGGGTLSGYPYQSYGTFVVLGVKDATTSQVAQVERLTAATLTATRGTVATSGPAGVARTDARAYSPVGYDSVYGTHDLVAEATTGAVVFSFDPKGVAIKNPVFRITGYPLTTDPTGVRMGTTNLVEGTDYVASRDGNTLWLVLKKTLSAVTTIGLNESAPPPPPPPPPAFTYADVNHILSTGQSNSVFNGGVPVLTTTQPYANISFNVGVMPGTQCDGNGCKSYQTPTSFIPLVEGDTFMYAVETMSSGMANQITRGARILFAGQPLPKNDHVVLVSLHGRSGRTYECLRKLSCAWLPAYVKPFDEAMLQVQWAKNIAAAQGKSHIVRAVTAVHGESNHYYQEFPLNGSDGTPGKITNYSDALVEWQQDYEAGVKAITGQTGTLPMLHAQMNGWSGDTNRTSRIPTDQLDAHVRAPGKVVLVGPEYNIPFRFDDGLHFTSEGGRRLGEYFAKVYSKIVFEGATWEPVRPKNITRTGNVITVQYYVPVPPLALDTTQVTNPGNYGFEFSDGTSVSIASVAVTAADTVTITLSATPTGATKRLRYAYTSPAPNSVPGPTTGVRGNLRDSDPTPSLYGNTLQNWGVTFDTVVP